MFVWNIAEFDSKLVQHKLGFAIVKTCDCRDSAILTSCLRVRYHNKHSDHSSAVKLVQSLKHEIFPDSGRDKGPEKNYINLTSWCECALS